MIQAMQSGISGMKAFKSALDVIGNNIANVNTTGYKAGRATFKEMLSQTMTAPSGPTANRGGINASQVGLGVMIGSVDVNNTQGSSQATGRGTDLMIEGNGFFALGGGDKIAYTRDGGFSLDAQYNLVSASSGMRVLGWKADQNTGVVDTSSPITGSSSIQIPVGGMSVARQTSVIDVSGNLDASAVVGSDPYEIKFDLYDSLGLTHQMQVKFTKLAADATATPPVPPSTWKYDVFCPDVQAAAVNTGNISFDTLGASTLDKIDLSLNFANNTGSVQPLNATINMEKISQLNGSSTVDLAYQNGLQLGTLESFSIDRGGAVIGTFTNGSTRALGQVAIVGFNNPAGLSKTGNNMLVESPNSGSPTMSIPGKGGLGLLSSGFLEASNVDLATEFASMIIAQRGFQANSRIISTSDEVLQELVSLKR
ncbi:MAG: flagellar hook protein FlgE [Armatimonadota bacterium]